MTPAGGIHGVGCGASVWSAGRGLCRYELGGLRMLVIGPLHLKVDANKDTEACVSRDDEYFGGTSGLEMRRTSCIYTIKDHESLDTTMRARRGDPRVGVPGSVVPPPPRLRWSTVLAVLSTP